MFILMVFIKFSSLDNILLHLQGDASIIVDVWDGHFEWDEVPLREVSNVHVCVVLRLKNNVLHAK